MTFSPSHLDRLRLRHLRLLELIDMHRSLRAVGSVLNLSQPAVSEMVKDLEYAFGVALVERSARGAALSPAGRQALQRARSGLASFDQLARELNAERPLTMRIGTNQAMMLGLVPAALGRMHASRTGMAFRLRTGMVGDMIQALWDGDLDCYVGRVDWDQMPARMATALRHDPLFQTELVLACPRTHPLAGRGDLSAGDLAGWSWALPSADSNNRIALEAGLRNHGVQGAEPLVEVAADPNALIILARELNLLTILARGALEANSAAAEFCVLDVPDLRLPPIQIGFVTLAEHEQMDSLRALRQALAEAVDG